MIIDQVCDMNVFIMGIIYPKIMCPNCVHTKLSCSGLNACCKFARLCLLLRLAESVVGSVGSQEDSSVTQQVALLCCFSLFCTMLHVCIESSVNVVLKIEPLQTFASCTILCFTMKHTGQYYSSGYSIVMYKVVHHCIQNRLHQQSFCPAGPLLSSG